MGIGERIRGAHGAGRGRAVRRHAGSRRRRRLGDRGSGAVEFTLAITVTLFLFVGIFELGRHYFARLTLRSAVAEAARFAVTGQTLPDPDSGDPLTRAESIQQVVMENADNLGVEVAQIVIQPPDGGQPGEVVTVQVQYTYDFTFEPIEQLMPALTDIVVTTAMKNEPAF